MVLTTKKKKITKGKKDKITEEKESLLTTDEMNRNIRAKVSGAKKWR